MSVLRRAAMGTRASVKRVTSFLERYAVRYVNFGARSTPKPAAANQVRRACVRVGLMAVVGYLATTGGTPTPSPLTRNAPSIRPASTTGAVPAPPTSMVVIDFDPTLSIRQLARDYLGDANLWPEILETSGIASIVELKPGQKLRLPVSLVKAATRAVQLSQEAIQRANLAGAQLFAPRIIAVAIRLYDQALVKQTLGAWLETFHLAQRSRTSAAKAYDVCRQHRDQAAQARLSDEQGSVEGQKPRELTWEDRQLGALLIEEEKVRTLSSSTAQITFRDASRLRLNPNSQAVIQRLRSDPLTREEDTVVSLIEGDFYALLADKSARKRFEVEVPGVEARVDSGDFWVRHDASGAKFANYDVDPVRIAAHGETVVLGRNEGTLVGSGEAPMRKLDVLPAPVPRAAQDDRPAIAGQVDLRWSAVAGATGYWLEIAHDPQFHRMATTHRGIPRARFQPQALAPGIYHWRVSALDRFGLPGARSQVQRLEVRADKTPPYLLIERPEPGRILRQAPVIVAGQSEPGARLEIDGRAVDIDAEGRFQQAITPAEGNQTVALRVIDRAGNETSKRHHITYMPDRPAEVQFAPDMPRLAPDHFLANGRVLPLAGRTIAHAQLAVEAEDGSRLAQAYGDDTGEFRINAPLTRERQKLTLRVIAPSGFVTTSPFTATIDRVAPEIVLEKPLPHLTADALLTIAGTLSETASLAANGRKIAVEAGRFSQRINLAEGRNAIELVATDAAGNVRVKRWSVRLDRTPPKPITHRIVATKEGSGTTLRVTATARDASGLARIARCTVGTDRWSSRAFLRYDRASQRYEGVVWTTKADAVDARLKQIELTDSAGNRRSFPLEVHEDS